MSPVNLRRIATSILVALLMLIAWAVILYLLRPSLLSTLETGIQADTVSTAVERAVAVDDVNTASTEVVSTEVVPTGIASAQVASAETVPAEVVSIEASAEISDGAPQVVPVQVSSSVTSGAAVAAGVTEVASEPITENEIAAEPATSDPAVESGIALSTTPQLEAAEEASSSTPEVAFAETPVDGEESGREEDEESEGDVVKQRAEESNLSAPEQVSPAPAPAENGESNAGELNAGEFNTEAAAAANAALASTRDEATSSPAAADIVAADPVQVVPASVPNAVGVERKTVYMPLVSGQTTEQVAPVAVEPTAIPATVAPVAAAPTAAPPPVVPVVESTTVSAATPLAQDGSIVIINADDSGEQADSPTSSYGEYSISVSNGRELEEENPAPGSKRIMLTGTLSNVAGQPVEIGAGNLALIDSSGMSYPVHPSSMEMSPSLANWTLATEENVYGFVVFEVPENLDLSTAKLAWCLFDQHPCQSPLQTSIPY